MEQMSQNEIISAAFGSREELCAVISERRELLRDYLRLPEKTSSGKLEESVTNFLARRAGADLASGIDVLDPVSYCEELTGKTDERVNHLIRPFLDGEDLNDVFRCD